MKEAFKQKAVIYARVSSVGQKTEGHGLDSQEFTCREYARFKNYEVVEVFQDDFTGAAIRRPGIDAMLHFLKRHRSSQLIVIIDDISRLARDLEAHITLRAAISMAGGILESPSIEFGEDPDSKLVENIQASVAQHFRQKNAKQTTSRMKARAGAGYWCWTAPIGYRYEKISGHGKLLVRDEPYASIVAETFELFASGRLQSVAETMRYLESRADWPHERRSRLTHERMRELLTRVVYTGHISIEGWGLKLVPAKHEPLISFETFKAVQRRMSVAAYVPARKDLNVDFPLRNAVRCGGCDAPLKGCWSTGT